MSAREMQIDRGLLEIAMPEQNLDRAKISSSLEKMRRKAVPQGMRMDVFVLETGANSILPTRRPEHLRRDRRPRRMPPVAGKQPDCCLVPEPAPVGAESFEQRRIQHHVPIPAALAAADVDHHSLAVNVGHLQMSHFSPACFPWHKES
jgi:hypothetical protein